MRIVFQCFLAIPWLHLCSEDIVIKIANSLFFFLINNFPELPIFSSRIPIIKRQYCIAGNFRQRKISSIATARQFVRNIFSSSAGRHSSAESSLIQLSLFCLSSIFAFMNVSDPKLAVCEKIWSGIKFSQKIAVTKATKLNS